MKKVRMIVEMDEELYKSFAEQDVFISGVRTGKTLLSEIWKALKNATIVRMSEEKIKESCSLSLVYNEGFDKGYEKAKAEYAPKWKRVEDGLPEDGEEVIILLKHFYLTRLLLTSFDETKARFYRCDRCYGINEVIAWMPIPKYEGVIEE